MAETRPKSLVEMAAKASPEALLSLTPMERSRLQYLWEAWARDSQLPPPGDWLTWLFLGGRGSGKTKAGAEFVRREVTASRSSRIALLGRTPADARDVMIEGESGLLNVFPRNQRPIYQPGLRKITFHTGAEAHIYSSENPEQLRGPQHDLAWIDELAAFHTFEAWDNLQFGLRLGTPRQFVSTTPRPKKVLRDLIGSPNTVVTRGTSYDNRANLAPAFYEQVIRRYEGTLRGQQELEGILLDEVPGALWNRNMIQYKDAPEIVQVIVGVDPSISDGEDAAECGIVTVGKGIDGHLYVLADASLRASPLSWARRVIAASEEYSGSLIVAEENQGGKMVQTVLRTVKPDIRYRGVRASQGKDARAEPVAALYEQGRVFHTRPFAHLEDQLCEWVPGDSESPDRLDALVWACYPMIRPKAPPIALGV